jgi:signal peptidase I
MIFKTTKTEIVFLIIFLLATSLIIGKLIKDKKYQDSLQYFQGTGDSMTPTILDGEEVVVDPNLEPEINDIIVFSCQKCKTEKDDIDILTKRVENINDQGCLWVEGDNKIKSYDSRDFGWLCPEEIEFLGTLIKDDSNNKYK